VCSAFWDESGAAVRCSECAVHSGMRAVQQCVAGYAVDFRIRAVYQCFVQAEQCILG